MCAQEDNMYGEHLNERHANITHPNITHEAMSYTYSDMKNVN